MTLRTWALEKARETIKRSKNPKQPLPSLEWSREENWPELAIAEALIEAERRGAERMRERAAKIAEAHAAAMSAELPNSAYTTGGVHVATSVAYDIRALPLDEESGS